MFNPPPPGSDKPAQPPTPPPNRDEEPAPDEVEDEGAAIAPDGRPAVGKRVRDRDAESASAAEALDVRLSAGPRSGPVTAVAAVNFIFGAYEFVSAIALLAGASFLGGVPGMAGAPAEFQHAAGQLEGLVKGLAILILFTGFVMGVAGLGVLARRRWGRILTLILGGLAVLAALSSLSPLNPLSLLFHAGYATLVFTVLLNPRFAPEYYPESARTAQLRSGATPERKPYLTWLTAPLCLAALLLGLFLGWGLFRPASPALTNGPPVALVIAGDAKSQAAAATAAGQLVHVQGLRVIDPALVPMKQLEAGAVQNLAQQLGANLLVIVTEENEINNIPHVQARVVVAKTGILLDTGRWQKGDFNNQQVTHVVQRALQKMGR